MIATLTQFVATPDLFFTLSLAALAMSALVATLLCFLVIRSDPRSATNVLFCILSLLSVAWLTSSYAFLVQYTADGVLWWARLSIAIATPLSAAFMLLARTLPERTLTIRGVRLVALGVVVLGISLLNLSPYAFTGVRMTDTGYALIPGIGLAPFAIASTLWSVLALYYLMQRVRRARAVIREQARTMFIGFALMLIFTTVTVLVPIIVTHATGFVTVTPLYVLVFLGATAYAIIKHQLFNLRLVAAEAFTGMLWIVLVTQAIVATTATARIIDITVLIITIVFGILLVRSVRREVRQREELQTLSASLTNANAALEDLSHFKTQLLSLASHQLKSPLAAIKGFATLIDQGLYGPIPAEAKVTLGKIRSAADNLVDLINMLLDVRKVEEGKMDYQFKQVDLVRMVRTMCDELEPLAGEKHLVLERQLPSIALIVHADEQKLTQVLQNLIDNAIKYTPQGSVTVTVRTVGQRVHMIVADTGLGIAPELIPHLFEEFVRDERVKQKIRGTGLGLFIARKIAEAHAGILSATSPGEGKGSTFTIDLPLVSNNSSAPTARMPAVPAVPVVQ